MRGLDELADVDNADTFERLHGWSLYGLDRVWSQYLVYRAAMSQNLRDYTKALYGFDHVMRSVPADAWDNASPCSGWTARDVAGHCMGVIEAAGAAARGGAAAHDFMGQPGPIAGSDPYSSWSVIRDQALESFDQPGALQRIAQTPFGEQPVDSFIGFIKADALIHTWDLARAVSGDEKLDAQLVDQVLAAMSPMAAMLAGSGVFAAPISVPDSADTQTRLLAMVGRAA